MLDSAILFEYYDMARQLTAENTDNAEKKNKIKKLSDLCGLGGKRKCRQLFLKLELVLEDGFEFINIVEIIYCIGRLSIHPFVPYHQVNNFAEIMRCLDPQAI